MGYELVVVGTSLGGLRALQILIGGLPITFTTPVAIVQHRLSETRSTLARVLQESSPLPLAEAEDKEEILKGRLYLAPPDYHLLIEPGHFALSTEGAVTYARPSIDALFMSAADAYGASVIGVVLTGANHDGAAGLARIKARGGCSIVQDPVTAECAIMPAAALSAAPVDHVLPLPDIAPFLVEATQTRPR